MSLKIAKLVESLAEVPLHLAIKQCKMVIEMQEKGLEWEKVIEVVKGWLANQVQASESFSVETEVAYGISGGLSFEFLSLSGEYSSRTVAKEAGEVQFIMTSNGKPLSLSKDLSENKEILKKLLAAQNGEEAEPETT